MMISQHKNQKTLSEYTHPSELRKQTNFARQDADLSQKSAEHRGAAEHRGECFAPHKSSKDMILEISLDYSRYIRKASQALPIVPSDSWMHQGSFLGRLQNLDV